MTVNSPQTGPDTYCDRCGQLRDDRDHSRCRLDPPRFCTRCGRRLKVQVYPDHYDARCLVCDA